MVTISPFSAAPGMSQGGQDRQAIADNFDTFLLLLTTQLRNQSPLDPLNTNEFTQQLVQFSAVEQAVKTNANLEKLAQITAANALNSAVGFIGKEVTAGTDKAVLSDSPATWQFAVPESSPSATFVVSDSNGRIVSTEARPVPGGENLYVWHGATNEGGTAPAGAYSLSIRADDGNGNQLQVTLGAKGIVEGIDMSGGEPLLIVNGRQVRLDEVASVRVPGA